MGSGGGPGWGPGGRAGWGSRRRRARMGVRRRTRMGGGRMGYGTRRTWFFGGFCDMIGSCLSCIAVLANTETALGSPILAHLDPSWTILTMISCSRCFHLMFHVLY
ncbi:hypothetical protein OIU84_017938 [Salix udensis]|uniref:Uncharacterized protein n=1 Tax=Salix udensis TaxID=889485 RepID=A0AAD6L301_9ROSI|nr:hypothetical protein OIU84_017938 [Salix udensis]